MESVLFYGPETWTLTTQLISRICGAYINLLRKALNLPWTAHMTNRELYGNLPRADDIIRHRRLHFAGHAARCSVDRYQPIADLVFWQAPGPRPHAEGARKQKDIPQDSFIGPSWANVSCRSSICATNRDE